MFNELLQILTKKMHGTISSANLRVNQLNLLILFLLLNEHLEK